MKPIYEPKGAAKEYGDLAINIYTGCPHRCYYCFAPIVLHKDREAFHSCVEPRKNIVAEVARQIEREKITGKLIHLCFSCDPFPTGLDCTPTVEIIRELKRTGNHVQILTKNPVRCCAEIGSKELLDENDWVGTTFTCFDSRKVEPLAEPSEQRLQWLAVLKAQTGCHTWVSFEPVLNAEDVLKAIRRCADLKVDKVKIGKLNYFPSTIRWGEFGREAEYLCKRLRLDYTIKEGLRKEMDKNA